MSIYCTLKQCNLEAGYKNIAGHNKYYVEFEVYSTEGEALNWASVDTGNFNRYYKLDKTFTHPGLASEADFYGDIDDIINTTITLRITYTRSLGKQRTVYFQFKLPITLDYNYHEPGIRVEEKEPLDPNGTVVLDIQGRYDVDYGDLRAVTYTLKKDGVDIRTDEVGPITKGNGVFSSIFTLTDLDYSSDYLITFIVSDSIASTTYDFYVSGALPLMSWDKDDVTFNVDTVFNGKAIARDSIVTDCVNGFGVDAIISEAQAEWYPTVDPYNQQYGGFTLHNLIVPMSSDDATIIGYPHYEAEHGTTRIYGNNVDIFSHNPVTINGVPIGSQNILWSGSLHMNSSQKVTLNKNISEQANGIVLVFSLFRGYAEDVSINSFFVSKKEVELLPGAPHTYMMNIDSGFGGFGAKSLYIYDNEIVGHEDNTSNGTNSGITFNNFQYVLRYVIGV